MIKDLPPVKRMSHASRRGQMRFLKIMYEDKKGLYVLHADYQELLQKALRIENKYEALKNDAEK